jgi:hypothetical protein
MKAALESCEKCRDILHKEVINKCEQSIYRAREKAIDACEKWGGPRKDGGHPWNTYLAKVCRW